MTRFTRAKGSKASNERVPEEATSWTTMKEQLEQKEIESVEKKKRIEFEAKRKENYKSFLEEREHDIIPKWVEFESTDKNMHNKAVKKNGKKRKIEDSQAKVEDLQLQEMIGEIEKVLVKDEREGSKGKANNKKKRVTDEVTNINAAENGGLSKKGTKNKIKAKRKINSDCNVEGSINIEKHTESDDDDNAPIETSAKVMPKLYKNKTLSFPKKTPLKIPCVNKTKNDEQQVDNNEKEEMDVKAWRAEKKRNKKMRIQQNKKLADKEKPKKSVDEMTEDELKRYNKKMEKKLRQLQNKKQRKAEIREKALLTHQNGNKDVNKEKIGKVRDNKDHNRRKPDTQVKTMFINGVDVKIDYFDGFPVKKEDADRLRKLKKEMISKSIPKSEVRAALKLERRKAEKALAREKKKVCFNCRKSGHVLSECPNLNESSQQEMIGTGICFKCGSTEHTHFECKVVKNDNFNYATCFICKQQGHISRQCPDNQKGLYPKGGACKVCGDVTHLKKDCPKFQVEQESQTIKLETMDDNNLEALPEDRKNEGRRDSNKHNKIIKF